MKELFFLTSDLSYEVGFTDEDQCEVVSSMVGGEYRKYIGYQETKWYKGDL